MTFEYRDSVGDALTAKPTIGTLTPGILLHIEPSNCVHVPLDRVEEVVAGIRDAARQAAGQPAALQCNWAHSRVGHEPHNWEPQPGMQPVHCPGYSEPAAEHVHKLGNADEDGGILDDWDNCRDPECPGPTAAEMARARQAAGQTPTTECALPAFMGCECGHLSGCQHPAPVVGQPAEAQPADRAATFNEAADNVALELSPTGPAERGYLHAIRDTVRLLRRMAVEETR
ncbi:hypothetical protein [Streptomyces sp. NPDC056543]|uniref:hypothetical protein n=1 Tax=unclassified Streptomyces TaxID=2593676 RepID=UPI00368342B2